MTEEEESGLEDDGGGVGEADDDDLCGGAGGGGVRLEGLCSERRFCPGDFGGRPVVGVEAAAEPLKLKLKFNLFYV